MAKLRVGILGATGMVGQRFVTLLADHPWFEVTVLAASPRSAGKPYRTAVDGRWRIAGPIPQHLAGMPVLAVREDMTAIAAATDVVFSALDLDKSAIKQLELDYAAAGKAVISNNSAHRWTEDVPILLPEINPDHAALIDRQRRERGWTTGLLAVKPNCSVQAYVAVLTALQRFEPTEVAVTSLQAVSGAGKTLETWPEMVDNVIPYIPGEEEKSEREPLKIWGSLQATGIRPADAPHISATCVRVPVSDGHMAIVSARFKHRPTKNQIIDIVTGYPNPLAGLALPTAPKQFITYLEADDRPQTRLDRNAGRGMGITFGRLNELSPQVWRFVALSHNTVRGAAGGAVLMAELLAAKGYIKSSQP